MDDVDHPFDLFGADGTSASLLVQQVENMVGELTARL